MAGQTVRSTLYIETGLHQALRLKAATAHRTMSDLVNDAIRAALQDDANELATVAEREAEPIISYEALLGRLRADLQPVRCKTPAEALLERWRNLPRVDVGEFRADIDSAVDSSL